jgi:hypothetical protein
MVENSEMSYDKVERIKIKRWLFIKIDKVVNSQ